METTTNVYDRGVEHGRVERLDDSVPGEALRIQKLHTAKGIGIFTACMVAMGLTMAVSFWMASYVAPEPEESQGWAHEARERPATEIEDPRTIGRDAK
ncbi:MAG: hypothetical protein M3Y87_16600 [Myxococcota bacterium]|nr:hypothetical protein [Myxococcota bacterium]